jgi:hypothetical protein
MSTQAEITKLQARINYNIGEIADYEAAVNSHSEQARQYEALKSTCRGSKKKKAECVNSRNNSVMQYLNNVKKFKAEIASYKAQNLGIEKQIASLLKDAESKRITADTLAQQGLTHEAIETAAEIEASANAQVVREAGSEDLEQKKKVNNIGVLVLILIVLGLGFFFYKKLKKK